MGGEDFPGEEPKTPKESDKRPEPESKGTPIDMTPDPKFPPLHRGEKLTRDDMIHMLESLRKTAPDDGEPPPPLNKDALEGK